MEFFEDWWRPRVFLFQIFILWSIIKSFTSIFIEIDTGGLWKKHAFILHFFGLLQLYLQWIMWGLYTVFVIQIYKTIPFGPLRKDGLSFRISRTWFFTHYALHNTLLLLYRGLFAFETTVKVQVQIKIVILQTIWLAFILLLFLDGRLFGSNVAIKVQIETHIIIILMTILIVGLRLFWLYRWFPQLISSIPFGLTTK